MSWFRRSDKRVLAEAIEQGKRERLGALIASLSYQRDKAVGESKELATLLAAERDTNEFLRRDLDGVISTFTEKLANERDDARTELARQKGIVTDLSEELEQTERKLRVTQAGYADLRQRYLTLSDKLNKAHDERDNLRDELSPLEHLAQQKKAS